MENKVKKLEFYFDAEISGDWGEDEPGSDTPVKVRCIRGADIESINTSHIEGIPIRYIKSSSDDKYLTPRDIVVEISGGSPTQSTGRSALVPSYVFQNSDSPIVCSNFCRALRVKDSHDPQFVFYALTNVYSQGSFFNFEGKTSGIKNLDLKAALNKIPTLKFDITDQKKISTILAAIDNLIHTNRLLQDELLRISQTIYEHWFIQYDFPSDDGKPYSSSGGTLKQDSKIKRSLPSFWSVEKLSSVLNTSLGGTPSTDRRDYWSGDIPWINSGEVDQTPVLITEKKITEAGLKNSASKLLPKHTVLLSIVRHLRVSFLSMDACTSQSVVGIEENEKLKHPYIYFSVLKDIPRLMSRRTGAQQPHINKDEVDISYIVIPDDKTLKSFNNLVLPMFETIENKARENKGLLELKNWLLPLLMNGQAKVN